MGSAATSAGPDGPEGPSSSQNAPTEPELAPQEVIDAPTEAVLSSPSSHHGPSRSTGLPMSYRRKDGGSPRRTFTFVRAHCEFAALPRSRPWPLTQSDPTQRYPPTRVTPIRSEAVPKSFAGCAGVSTHSGGSTKADENASAAIA